MENNDKTISGDHLERAYMACGCFWGVQFYMGREPGVVKLTCGYMGGSEERPTYQEVKAHLTGHAEAVEIVYDPAITSYKNLCRLFFEIHDPAQVGGIGSDLGPQYRSEIFYTHEEQLATAREVIADLKSRGYVVNTRLTPSSPFWPAEEYHQNYFEKNGGEPDCHFRIKKF